MKASESNLDSHYHMSDIADKELYEITKKVKKYDDSKGIVTISYNFKVCGKFCGKYSQEKNNKMIFKDIEVKLTGFKTNSIFD